MGRSGSSAPSRVLVRMVVQPNSVKGAAFAGQVIHDGVYEITAANGDKLWGVYSGALQPTEFGDHGPIRGIITSPSTIDGGTGRFAGAQGEYLAVGDYDLVADQGSFKFTGWISCYNP